jgi:uncharacterized phage protein (TIGR01671 family)
MREIKFRAWQKQYNEMYQPHSGWIEFHKGELSLVGFSDGDLQLRPDDVVLMQFTGLKDRKGREIYEGDILLIPDDYIETVDVGVGLVPVASLPDAKIAAVSWYDHSWGTTLGHWYQMEDDYDMEKIEVIGNIYENPDLLS